MDIDTIVFDFNGTIVDDLDVCLDILNNMLGQNGHPMVTKERYLEIFTFPVFDYYVKAGFDILPGGKDDFKALSHVFDKAYRQAFPTLNIFPDLKEFLAKYHKKVRLLVLSATKHDSLVEEIEHLGLKDYFDDLIGITNIYAVSKINEAKEYFASHHFDAKKTLFLGDTLHDNEIAQHFGSPCILIARGHQSHRVLESGHPFKVVDNFKQVEDLIS